MKPQEFLPRPTPCCAAYVVRGENKEIRIFQTVADARTCAEMLARITDDDVIVLDYTVNRVFRAVFHPVTNVTEPTITFEEIEAIPDGVDHPALQKRSI